MSKRQNKKAARLTATEAVGMAEIGIPPDANHVSGVAGISNRIEYLEQKEALEHWIKYYPEEVPKPPRDFKEQEAVIDYVNKIIVAVLRELNRSPPRLLRADELEAEAVSLAERGNYRALAALLRERHPLNAEELAEGPCDRDDFHGFMPSWALLPKGQIRSSLAPSTYELIADILTGKHKKWGRPPAAAGDRRKMTPVHDAADLLPIIEDILRKAYPDQNSNQIKDRAMLIAARRKRINTKKLRNLTRRKPSDRRRLQNP